jgi:hypothetical protein
MIRHLHLFEVKSPRARYDMIVPAPPPSGVYLFSTLTSIASSLPDARNLFPQSLLILTNLFIFFQRYSDTAGHHSAARVRSTRAINLGVWGRCEPPMGTGIELRSLILWENFQLLGRAKKAYLISNNIIFVLYTSTKISNWGEIHFKHLTSTHGPLELINKCLDSNQKILKGLFCLQSWGKLRITKSVKCAEVGVEVWKVPPK